MAQTRPPIGKRGLAIPSRLNPSQCDDANPPNTLPPLSPSLQCLRTWPDPNARTLCAVPRIPTQRPLFPSDSAFQRCPTTLVYQASRWRPARVSCTARPAATHFVGTPSPHTPCCSLSCSIRMPVFQTLCCLRMCGSEKIAYLPVRTHVFARPCPALTSEHFFSQCAGQDAHNAAFSPCLSPFQHRVPVCLRSPLPLPACCCFPLLKPVSPSIAH